MQIELLLQSWRIVRNVSVPGLEVRLGQLEDLEATILLLLAVEG